MKITHTTTLFIAAITVLDCSAQQRSVTWFEAQRICRDMNQSITLNKNESEQYYWTGLYERTSHWIKIIGCYSESTLQNSIITFLSSSSPFQCQEYCLQQSIEKFAVKERKCFCLSHNFDVTKNLLPSSKCTYTCSNSTLLSTECGGNLTVNVFFSDRKNMESIQDHCISLQCGENPTFVYDIECFQSQPPLCSTSFPWPENLTSKYWNWTECMELCKENGTYLAGNIDLSNLTTACLGHVHTSPYWIGVLREKYFNTDQGQSIEQSTKTFFNRCQRCTFKGNVPECEFVECENTKSKVICSETKEVIVQISDTTYRSTTLQETTGIHVSEITTEITTGINTGKTSEITTGITTGKTSEITTGITTGRTTESSDTPQKKLFDSIKDSSTIPIAVSMVLVLFVVSGSVIAIIIYKRRKHVLQEKDTKSTYVPPAKESEKYTDSKTYNDTNYFVLQRSNPTYELADNSKLEFESPYNEAEEGTYDHLGEKKARKRPADDIYNHASSAELLDLSDYDVANHKHLNSEDNTYDHTCVGDDSYGKVKSDLSDYDVANRKPLNEEDSTYDHAGVEGDSYGKYNSSQVNETDYSELS